MPSVLDTASCEGYMIVAENENNEHEHQAFWNQALDTEASRWLAESLGSGSGPADEHPDLEDLAAYHEGGLEPTAREAIGQHLLLCDDCAAVILDLTHLDDPSASDDATGPSEHEIERAWRKQKELLAHDGVLTTEPARNPALHVVVRPTLPPWLRAAAAVLLTTLFGLGFWVVSLRQTVEDLQRLQTNPPLANLEPVDSSRRSASDLPILALPDERSRGWLILNLAGPLAGSTFRAELLDTDGKTLLVFDPIARTEVGNFRMEISRHDLPTGEIRIHLLERSSDDAEILAEYRFRLTAL